MILIDKDIKNWVDDQKILCENFVSESVINCGYDLTTHLFYTDQKEKAHEIILQPGGSVFASSNEILTVPLECCIRVVLKNSRIRQGLSLEAPLYQPGHKTRIYFRLTNVSSNAVTLSNSEKYATIIFEQLSGIPENTYKGTFSDEFSFVGMGNYQDTYEKQIEKIEKKANDLKNMEKSIYSNVSILLSIFIALFTLLATNVWGISKDIDLGQLLIIDLTLMGCISFLIGLLSHALDLKNKKNWGLLVISAVFFIAAIFLYA